MENQGKILLYDGSFNGFLTTIYEIYEKNIIVMNIQKTGTCQNALFTEIDTIGTQVAKAERVWNNLRHKNYNALKNIYFAFLSEQKSIEWLLYQYIQKLYARDVMADLYDENTTALKIGQIAKAVEREKLSLEAKLQFQITEDDVYLEIIEPEFNIIPLVSKHFRTLHRGKEWIIYDAKRNYGIHYCGGAMEFVVLDLENNFLFEHKRKDRKKIRKDHNPELWNDYFKSNHIRSRIHKMLPSRAVA